MAYSGEGNLIEGQIEGDPNKTVIPVAVDSDGHLIIDLDASTITIGTVDQGASGTDPWLVKIDQNGVNNNVDAAVTNFPANQNVTVTNGTGVAAVNIQDGGNSLTVDGPLTDAQLRASPVPVSGSFSPSGTQDVNIVSTIPVPVTDNGGSLTIDGTVAISNFPATQPVSGTVTANIGTTGGLALDATLTNATQKTKIVDTAGVNVAVVDATGDIQVDINNFPAIQAISFSSNSTATESNVAASITNVTLLASNASRKMAMIYNDSTSDLYVKLGTTASTSSFTVKMVSQAYYELPIPVYTGQIDGIWTIAVGSARMTEY